MLATTASPGPDVALSFGIHRVEPMPSESAYVGWYFVARSGASSSLPPLIEGSEGCRAMPVRAAAASTNEEKAGSEPDGPAFAGVPFGRADEGVADLVVRDALPGPPPPPGPTPALVDFCRCRGVKDSVWRRFEGDSFSLAALYTLAVEYGERCCGRPPGPDVSIERERLCFGPPWTAYSSSVSSGRARAASSSSGRAL